jgi:hypothetical protein
MGASVVRPQAVAYAGHSIWRGDWQGVGRAEGDETTAKDLNDVPAAGVQQTSMMCRRKTNNDQLSIRT